MRKRLTRLSRADLLNLAELSHATAKAKSIEGATALFRSLEALLPLRGAVWVLARWDGNGEMRGVHQLLNFGYPPEWLALYRERRYDRVDPVLRGDRSGNGVQLWSQAFAKARSADEHSFVDACMAFDLREGMTVGVGGVLGFRSLLSFWGGDLERAARHRTVIEFLAPAFHDFLNRLVAVAPSEESRETGKSLTRRERQTLYWAGFGKTTWEIGRIVGISERTVMFHLGNAMEKLNARNRAHAIAKAAQRGMLDHPP
jgi:LuxR family quorum-sensing system transcriptional regulator CciR